MNVSQEEYARMYQVYLSSIEEGRRERWKREELELEITAQRFYSFTNSDHAVRRYNAIKNLTWLYFPIEIPEMQTVNEVEVDHANLRVLVSTKGTRDVELKVRVYMLKKPYRAMEQDSRVLIDTRTIHVDSSGSKWTEFDVTVAAETWMTSSEENNFGLELECTKEGVDLITGGNAVINILINVRTRSREKRSTDDGNLLSPGQRNKHVQCRKDGHRCCRHPMAVFFRELEGFEFILQPKSFDAGYCKGRCPPRYNPAHHHAILQSLIWKKNRERAPKPCCAPSKLRELEILHLDEENNTKLKVTKWKDIKVTECACS